MRSKGQTLHKALVINCVFERIQKDTMLLQDYLDPKLKYSLISSMEDVFDWSWVKNAFKTAFCRNYYIWTNANCGGFVNVIFTFVRECLWFFLSVLSY